jgi:predicted nucleotide-binding protein (sugar kinase/HSP70/actin superfamily)
VVATGGFFIRPALTGEAILTAGSAKLVFEDHSTDNFCGVILIGPFNCMPTGVAESVVKPYARQQGIPYLTFETDGGPMPPNLRSQVEVHILRSKIYAAEHQPGPRAQ